MEERTRCRSARRSLECVPAGLAERSLSFFSSPKGHFASKSRRAHVGRTHERYRYTTALRRATSRISPPLSSLLPTHRSSTLVHRMGKRSSSISDRWVAQAPREAQLQPSPSPVRKRPDPLGVWQAARFLVLEIWRLSRSSPLIISNRAESARWRKRYCCDTAISARRIATSANGSE